jgi:hypothetical protein
MCPKGTAQIGYAVPMEVSKCRDNCIDSRVTPDGKITCAYEDWLTKVADNQESVMARLDGLVIAENEDDTLNDISRPGPAEIEESIESRYEDDDKLKEQNKKYKREELLEKSMEESMHDRKLNTKQASSEKRTIVSQSNNNNREASMKRKSFNLSQHIGNNQASINDRLEKYRDFFGDSLNDGESISDINQKGNGENKYTSPHASMEDLVGERRTGNPEKTMEEQISTEQKGDIAQHMQTMEEQVGTKRNDDPMSKFMKTLNESLDGKRLNASD